MSSVTADDLIALFQRWRNERGLSEVWITVTDYGDSLGITVTVY
jgi:hypothetical protein